ncbi:MAG: cobalamin B12-binding domain-containing protein [Nitrospirae bacterium]|nr:cobalamin B12-binding domain-containing protein [Nitrospirota bacterium]
MPSLPLPLHLGTRPDTHGWARSGGARGRYRLLLIDPYPEDNAYRMNDTEMRAIWFPKLSLPVIAGHTPKHWDVQIIDESRTIVRPDFIDQVVRETGVERLFVGISTQMSCYTPRAYEIADQFRARGVKVCLGGTHATYLPEEAAAHADVVVRFEADDLWPQVLRDFEQGALKPLYEMTAYPTMEHYPHPRVDLLPQGCYMTNQCLQTTRGCHFDCEFCSVSPFNGKSSRRRPVEEVVGEIQRIIEWRRSKLVDQMTTGPVWHRIGTSLRILVGMEGGRIFAFVDDLHNSNRAYCKKLWTALKELNIKWGAQCTLFLGNEPEMVKLAAESGCVAMFVGMESISGDVLAEMNKPFNQEKNFANQIQCFHDHGIMINPGVIFGSDADDESVFETTVEFLIKARVELAYMNILTPLPGTVLFDRMKAEGRIIDTNWANYDGKHVVYRPKRMSPETLQEGFFWANQEFYSYPSIFTRVFATQQRLIPRFEMNRRFRQLVYRTTPKATLTPVARALKALQTQFPAAAQNLQEELIPSALEAIRTTVDNVSEQIDRIVKVKARRAESLKALLIDLEGTLDQINAKALIEKLRETAAQTKLDLVINCRQLRHATPAAIAMLLDRTWVSQLAPGVKVRYVNLKQAYHDALERLALSGSELLSEEGS